MVLLDLVPLVHHSHLHLLHRLNQEVPEVRYFRHYPEPLDYLGLLEGLLVQLHLECLERLECLEGLLDQ